jgi:phytoene dehydrogenase-like protein
MSSTDSYDGIFIGGGHQALVGAAYMAKAGLDVLVLEQDLHVGGGLKTRDVTGQGFLFNLCAKGHYNITGTPWYGDLNLADYGLEYIDGETDFAMITKDGDAVVLGRDTERTLRSIEQISEDDAEQFAQLQEIANEIVGEIYLPQRFDEPLPADERRHLLESSELGRTFLEWTTTPVIHLLNQWFESEEVILLMMQQMTLFGEPGEGWEAPSHTGGIARCFESDYGYEVAKGGSESLAIALQQAVQQNGGTVLTNSDVERIGIGDDRATGVTLTDGRQFRADEFVASGINPHLTFEELVGPEHIDESFATVVHDFEMEKWSTVHVHFALEESPEYTDDGGLGVGEAAFQFLGVNEIDELGETMESVMKKELPLPDWVGVNVMTELDPSQAPPGKHVATLMGPAPYDLRGDSEEWKAASREIRDHYLDVWREYAPNMTEDNVIDSYVTHPQRIASWNPNMVQGRTHLGEMNGEQVLDKHFGYRTPIDRLYMCGSSSHPGGGINGGAGYVAAKIIHEDLGIDPWWDPVDFRACLENLQ